MREQKFLSEVGKEKESECFGMWSAWEQGISGKAGLTNFTTYRGGMLGIQNGVGGWLYDCRRTGAKQTNKKTTGSH